MLRSVGMKRSKVIEWAKGVYRFIGISFSLGSVGYMAIIQYGNSMGTLVIFMPDM